MRGMQRDASIGACAAACHADHGKRPGRCIDAEGGFVATGRARVIPDVRKEPDFLNRTGRLANEPADAPIEAPADARAVLGINAALVLVLGIVPGGLMALCAQAVAGLAG